MDTVNIHDPNLLIAVLVVIVLVAVGAWLFYQRQQSKRLEQRFGFNTTTQRLWLLDRLKGLLLALILGYPLLTLLLKLVYIAAVEKIL